MPAAEHGSVGSLHCDDIALGGLADHLRDGS